MNSDNVTNAMDNWEVLEAMSLENNSSEVVLSTLGVHGWINDLQRADIVLLGSFVWEGSINDDTVEVVSVLRDERAFSKFSVSMLRNISHFKILLLAFPLSWFWGRMTS